MCEHLAKQLFPQQEVKAVRDPVSLQIDERNQFNDAK